MEVDKQFNSIKLILILLVVWGHACQYNMLDDRAKLVTFSFFSSFAMPMFIMITGFLSKKINWKKYKKSSLSLLVTYFTFQFIYSSPSIINAIFKTDIPVFGGEFDLIRFLFIPSGPLWYILGLLFWRLIACVLAEYKISYKWAIPVSIIVAIGLGFIPVTIPSSRIVVFTFFFLLGYYCPKELLIKVKNMNKAYAIAVFLSLFLLSYFFISKEVLHMAFFGEVPFNTISSLPLAIGYRLIFFVIGTLASMAALNLIPTTFQKWGSKSLNIYLLHPLFVYPVYYAILFALGITFSLYVDLIVSIVIVILCIWISKIRVTRYLFSPMLLLNR